MEQSDDAFPNPWEAEARYHDNGLPANMAAVLRDQWKRNRRKAGFVASTRGGFHG